MYSIFFIGRAAEEAYGYQKIKVISRFIFTIFEILYSFFQFLLLAVKTILVRIFESLFLSVSLSFCLCLSFYPPLSTLSQLLSFQLISLSHFPFFPAPVLFISSFIPSFFMFYFSIQHKLTKTHKNLDILILFCGPATVEFSAREEKKTLLRGMGFCFCFSGRFLL